VSWSTIVGLALKAIVDWLLGRERDARAEQTTADRAVASGAAETETVVAEVADAQARVAVDGPDGADALAAELRARAARLAAGGAGGGSGRR
jgi:hypothetical protein